MKKLFLIALLFLSSLTMSSQNTYIPWKLTNNGCFGCASFYWMVTQTYMPDMAKYKYDIWFYSNSFYSNGNWASTYVQGLYFTVDGFNLYKDPSWILFKDKYCAALTTFYTPNPAPIVQLTWSTISIY